MELKDFISNTIEQISLGIIQASEKCSSLGVIVNPDVTVGSNGDFVIPKKPERINLQRRVQLLDMDIAIVVTESEEGKVDGKIGVSFIGVGADMKKGKSTANESRVKFSIPVCLPITSVIE